MNFERQDIGHTTLLTLNNPPAHTWTKESLIDLKNTLNALNADSKNRALVITGAGDRFFSAGADLAQFNHEDEQRSAEFADAFYQAFTALSTYRGVSIAAINGYAMGGGLEAALSCDIRIAESGALMALPECTVGLLPCGLGTQQLTLLIGEQWAKRMILLGEKVNADQALAIGLISEVVAKGSARDHALALCENLASQSPLAVEYCKALIMGARDHALSSQYLEEQKRFAQLFKTRDRKEGVQAFLEKRKAQWENH